MMYRGFVMALVVACWCGPAAAQQECIPGLIEFVDYSIEPIDEDTNSMTTTFRSTADRTIRMIDASAGYRDALGGSVASFALERDVLVEPGDTFVEQGTWGPYTFERLLKLKKNEVDKFVCVRNVLYDDGTKAVDETD